MEHFTHSSNRAPRIILLRTPSLNRLAQSAVFTSNVSILKHFCCFKHKAMFIKIQTIIIIFHDNMLDILTDTPSRTSTEGDVTVSVPLGDRFWSKVLWIELVRIGVERWDHVSGYRSYNHTTACW